MLGAPTAMLPGVPKDAGCWEGWRDFLDFLKNGILMVTAKTELYRRQKMHLAPCRMDQV